MFHSFLMNGQVPIILTILMNKLPREALLEKKKRKESSIQGEKKG